MRTVGIRDLKQNASSVIRRVKAGESIEVTERGRPVARLVPIPASEDPVERLVAEGLAAPGEGSIVDLPPPIVLPRGRRLPSTILAELRDQER